MTLLPAPLKIRRVMSSIALRGISVHPSGIDSENPLELWYAVSAPADGADRTPIRTNNRHTLRIARIRLPSTRCAGILAERESAASRNLPYGLRITYPTPPCANHARAISSAL